MVKIDYIKVFEVFFGGQVTLVFQVRHSWSLIALLSHHHLNARYVRKSIHLLRIRIFGIRLGVTSRTEAQHPKETPIQYWDNL